ncbi:cation-transporting P-type ATPase [Streptomyces sp. C11-1]|uniref:Cation-transporting P-type ATPase n=1 Tax=Streptomyces durocortorensis TaxID=2811104 RepID=A0ABY9VP66_9ACTN|nr:cation-transporting P-type ATPase [Streptomyces durocortorensis]WNF25734.1 cation-transporting P-type ATPase [Streptomyces durocortorensis]
MVSPACCSAPSARLCCTTPTAPSPWSAARGDRASADHDREQRSAGAGGPQPDAHQCDAADVAGSLAVVTARGLTTADAERRADAWGANELAEPVRRPQWLRLLDQFRSWLIGIPGERCENGRVVRRRGVRGTIEPPTLEAEEVAGRIGTVTVVLGPLPFSIPPGSARRCVRLPTRACTTSSGGPQSCRRLS